jgi:hypothetical protein
VVRVLRLITELRTIVSSILGSFKSLGWVVVLLLLMIYIVACYFTQTVTDNFRTESESGNLDLLAARDTWDPESRTLGVHFGSLARAILSLYQSMSGGLDWDVLAAPLLNRTGFLPGFLFVSFIAFALLAMLNVVTGVFVQTALQSARLEEDSFISEQIVTLFNNAGLNEDSAISLTEVLQAFEDPEAASELRAIGVGEKDANFLFHLLLSEDQLKISFDEFLAGCLRLHGGSKSIDMLALLQGQKRCAIFQTKQFEAIYQCCCDTNHRLGKLLTSQAKRLEAPMAGSSVTFSGHPDSKIEQSEVREDLSDFVQLNALPGCLDDDVESITAFEGS